MDMTKKIKSAEDQGLAWTELFQGTLVKRYKRGRADVELDDGHMVTAH